MDQYEKLAKVGEGTYGVVYKAIHLPSNNLVAMKKIRIRTTSASSSSDDEDGVPATAIREIATLRELHTSPSDDPSDSSDPSDDSSLQCVFKTRIGTLASDHVVQLLDVLHEETRLHLVFEFVDCDLKRYMEGMQGLRAGMRASREVREAGLGVVGLGISVEKEGRRREFGPGGEEDGVDKEEEDWTDWEGKGLPAGQVKSLTYQLLTGLHHLHSRRILHRDLKPQNLLIHPHGSPTGGPMLKIADFGLARTFGLPVRTYTHEIITLYYRPPEVLLGGRHYGTAVDMWSVGCIMGEMATGKPVFGGDSELGQVMKIFQVLGTPDETCWPAVTELPDYNPAFPQFWPQDLARLVPELPFEGLDLLAGCLIYNSLKRVSAKEALTHPYVCPPSPYPHSHPHSHHGKTPTKTPKRKPRTPHGERTVYPTPPMTTRPRASSKLAQSPMTIPLVVESPAPVASPQPPPPPPPSRVDAVPGSLVASTYTIAGGESDSGDSTPPSPSMSPWRRAGPASMATGGVGGGGGLGGLGGAKLSPIREHVSAGSRLQASPIFEMGPRGAGGSRSREGSGGGGGGGGEGLMASPTGFGAQRSVSPFERRLMASPVL